VRHELQPAFDLSRIVFVALARDFDARLSRSAGSMFSAKRSVRALELPKISFAKV
jgi:hypothetical protein